MSFIASAKISMGGQKMIQSFCKASSIPMIKFFDSNPAAKGVHEFTSPTLMKYLGSEYKIENHWYPATTALRTRVDDYMDWYVVFSQLVLSSVV